MLAGAQPTPQHRHPLAPASLLRARGWSILAPLAPQQLEHRSGQRHLGPQQQALTLAWPPLEEPLLQLLPELLPLPVLMEESRPQGLALPSAAALLPQVLTLLSRRALLPLGLPLLEQAAESPRQLLQCALRSWQPLLAAALLEAHPPDLASRPRSPQGHQRLQSPRPAVAEPLFPSLPEQRPLPQVQGLEMPLLHSLLRSELAQQQPLPLAPVPPLLPLVLPLPQRRGLAQPSAPPVCSLQARPRPPQLQALQLQLLLVRRCSKLARRVPPPTLPLISLSSPLALALLPLQW
mmetsp:Transcript_43324/g.101966  ORF Transcript_43324/g.101966 Transcript_43324/m.101966 type:complete len:293 (-) Transcript_43324:293-1171(-)